jgi:hypothetical protein
MRLVLPTYSHSVSVSFLTLVRKDGVVATLSVSGSRFNVQRILVSLKQLTSIETQKLSKAKDNLECKINTRTGHENPEEM